jgi:hypothetical protein
MAMTPHTRFNTGHSERQSAAHKKIKESHFMNTKHFLRITLFALLMVALAATGAQTQLSTASLSGSITDPTGAVVPNAKITLIQTDTNFTRVSTSKDDGTFHEEFLPLGPYKISVAAAGFKTLQRSGIVLSVMQSATLNLMLEVGGQSETISVTADVPLVNVSDSTLGASISNVQIDNLPLVGRNAYDLLSLSPGIQSVSNENSIGLPMEHVIINGSTDNMVGQVTYYLDGGINMTGVRDTGNMLPNPDAIDQFNVQTNNFSAEYGRTGAGVLSVVTKSGTNKVHGSLFEFHQETNFNSDAWLQITRTPLHKNLFGATVGGPALRDKIFFFGSYGGLRQIAPVTFNTVVPDAYQRVGNFSENLPTTTPVSGLGACATTLNAADKANTNYGGKFFVCDPVTHQPVPGNRLDQDTNFVPDPVATAVLTQNVPLPSPNRTDNRYVGNEGLPNANNEYLIKGDFQIVPNHRVTLAYFQMLGSSLTLPSGSNLLGWALSNYAYRQQNGNASDVWTLSSRSVNQIWLSYSRMLAGRISGPAETLAAFGSDLNVQGTPSLAQISVANFFTLGNAISGPLAGDNIYGLRDVFNTTRGKHEFSAGGEAYLEKDRLETLLNNYGVFAFTSAVVPSTTSGQATYTRTGVAMSDFLIGHPNAMSQDSPDDANENYWNYGFFLQDNWRVSHALTLNLGARYDVQTAPIDTQRRIAVFQPGVQSTVSPTAMLGQLFPGDPGVPDGGVDTNYNHISPRIGFAYSPFGNGRTIIHGAAGMFFDTISGNEWMLSQNFQPFAVRETGAFTHVVSLKHIYSTDPTDFAGGVSLFPYVYNKTNPTYVSPASLVFVQKGMRWPYNTQVNFGVQQQLTKDLALSVNYVGVFNRKLPLYIDQNAPIYNTANIASNTTGDVNCRRPYDAIPFATGSTTACASPAVGSKYMSNAYVITDGQTANYHGLQVSFEKRLSHSFSINGFFIWSKGLASASMQTTGNIGNSASTEPEDYHNVRLDRQREDNDRRNMALFSAVWKPNYFGHYSRLTRTALNGWSLAATLKMNSGAPFNITSGSDDNLDGDNNDRPNIMPGMVPNVLDPHRARTQAAAQWFQTNAYCRVASAGCSPGGGSSGLDGLVSPNSLDAPGYKNVDASLFRDFTIYSRVKFQFRGEATNVFNFVNLGFPGGVLSSTSSFGVISGAGAMRVIQVGGRLLF